MNLHDCAVAYIAIPDSVLSVSSKMATLAALEVYALGSIHPLETGSPSQSPYERRKRGEITQELVHRGVIVETDSGLQLLSLDMEAERSIAKERIAIPARIDFHTLSVVSIKVLLACYALARYSRTPFQIEVTQAELAARARVTEKSVRTALGQLSERELVKTRKLWRAATSITLLEPESGVELFYLGEFYRRRLDSIPVFDRFKQILKDYDPKDKLKDISSPVRAYTTHCPFCTKPGSSPRFTFDVEADHWRCFNCRRGGTSARLWARLEPWWGKQNWRMLMGESWTAQPATEEFSQSEDQANDVN